MRSRQCTRGYPTNPPEKSTNSKPTPPTSTPSSSSKSTPKTRSSSPTWTLANPSPRPLVHGMSILKTTTTSAKPSPTCADANGHHTTAIVSKQWLTTILKNMSLSSLMASPCAFSLFLYQIHRIRPISGVSTGPSSSSAGKYTINALPTIKSRCTIPGRLSIS